MRTVGKHRMVHGQNDGLIPVFFDYTLQFLKKTVSALYFAIIIYSWVLVPIYNVPLCINGDEQDLVIDLYLLDGASVLRLKSIIIIQR
mgnify:CR=1 FL=1